MAKNLPKEPSLAAKLDAMATPATRAMSYRQLIRHLSAMADARSAVAPQSPQPSAAPQIAAPAVVNDDVNFGVPQAEPEVSKSFRTFKGIIEHEKSEAIRQAIYCFYMVGSLLQDAHHPHSGDPDDTLVKALGFDLDNLEGQMQAVFSEMRNRVVSQDQIERILAKAKITKEKTLFYDLLDLNDSSDEASIRERLRAFAHTMRRFPELLAYDKEKILEVIKAVKENVDPGKTTADIVEEAGLVGCGVVFDEDFIAKKSQSAANSRGARSAVNTLSETDLENFYRENNNLPAFLLFQGILMAFSQGEKFFPEANFNDCAMNVVMQDLDEMFPQMTLPGLGTLVAQNKSIPEVLAVIMQAFKINTPLDLRARLDLMHDKITRKYPNAISAARSAPDRLTPVPDSNPATDRIDIDPIDYLAFYEALKISQASYICQTFTNLHGAMTDEKTFKKIFGNDSDVGAVADAIIARFPDQENMALRLYEAAKGGDRRTSLIRAIASIYHLEDDADSLRQKLIEVNDALVALFPNLATSSAAVQASEPAPDSVDPDSGEKTSSLKEKITTLIGKVRKALKDIF